MTKEFVTYGHVDVDGKLSIYNRDIFSKTIQNKFKNTSVELVLRNRFYPFNDKIRGYYFAVIVKEIQRAFLASGVIKSMNEVDYDMRGKFLYYETLNPDNGEYELELHTLRKGDTLVSRAMMSDYVEKCIIWSSQNLDWAIPYPSEEFNESDMTEHQQTVKKIGTSDNSTF